MNPLLFVIFVFLSYLLSIRYIGNYQILRVMLDIVASTIFKKTLI